MDLVLVPQMRSDLGIVHSQSVSTFRTTAYEKLLRIINGKLKLLKRIGSHSKGRRREILIEDAFEPRTYEATRQFLAPLTRVHEPEKSYDITRRVQRRLGEMNDITRQVLNTSVVRHISHTNWLGLEDLRHNTATSGSDMDHSNLQVMS